MSHLETMTQMSLIGECIADSKKLKGNRTKICALCRTTASTYFSKRYGYYLWHYHKGHKGESLCDRCWRKVSYRKKHPLLDKQCLTCGISFHTKTSDSRWSYCSKRCKIRSPGRRLYYQNHKEEWKEYNKEYNSRRNYELKMDVYKHYSPELKCPKCGFDDIRALSIDHVNGGGRNKTAYKRWLYKWIIDHNYPAEFQILCMNCQWIKRVERNELRRIKP